MEVRRGSVEVIFFDAAGTLFEVRGSVGEIYQKIALRYGVQSEPSELENAFVKAFESRSPLAYPGLTGADLARAERRWWLELVHQVVAGRVPAVLVGDYFDEVFETFRRAEAWRLFPETRASLENLRFLRHRLAIISNFDSRLHDLLINLGIDSFFEQVVISSQAGAAKPDGKIFLHALERMKVTASEALHVGDSLLEDVEGARRMGIRPVMLDRSGRYENWKDGWRVQNLVEFCAMVEGTGQDL